MFRRRIVLGLCSLCIACAACVGAAETQTDPVSLLGQAVQLAQKSDADSFSKAFTLTFIASRYVKCGLDTAEVGRLLDQALGMSAGEDIKTEKTQLLYGIAITYARAHEYTKAHDVAVMVDTADIVSAVNGLRALHEKDISAVIAAAGEIKSKKSDEEIRELLLADLCIETAESGYPDKAFDIAALLPDASLKAYCFAKIAGRYIQDDKKEKALALLAQGEKIANAITDEQVFFVGSALAQITWQYAKAREFAHAVKIAEGDLHPYCKTIALAGIAGEYVRAGQNDLGSQYLFKALRESRNIEYFYGGGIPVVDLYVLYGEYDRAADAVGYTLAEGGSDDLAKAVSLAVIASRSIERMF